MTVLITGGAGFIGTNFVYYMLEKHTDYRIVCLDSLTYAGNFSSLKKAAENPRFAFYKTDITDKKAVCEVFVFRGNARWVLFGSYGYLRLSLIFCVFPPCR